MENVIASLQDAWAKITAADLAMGELVYWLICLVVVLVLIYIIRIHIAYKMAKNRNRDVWGWTLLSFFVSPVLVWILLLILGSEPPYRQDL